MDPASSGLRYGHDAHAPIGPVLPTVRLRSARFQTFLYRKMVQDASADAKPGDCVLVLDKHGTPFGHGMYNPRSTIALRMVRFGPDPVGDDFWRARIRQAVSLRHDVLKLRDATNAYRLVHAEGDMLSGLVVDVYDDVLSLAIYSLGMWRLAPRLVVMLHEAAGTRHAFVHMDAVARQLEGCSVEEWSSEGAPRRITIHEHGLRFRVCFASGHKTGFFCDQRENRRAAAALARGADVLDLCCYTGGFGIYAKALGAARHVACVDLDEAAVALCRENTNLNQARVEVVHADVFPYLRQMQTNNRRFDVVILDPPKLVFTRDDPHEGKRKYADLNRLAAAVVKPGGVLLSCSCSGALPPNEFAAIVTSAVRRAGRSCQLFNHTGAGPDHPVSPLCRESSYLKALWLRILPE